MGNEENRDVRKVRSWRAGNSSLETDLRVQNIYSFIIMKYYIVTDSSRIRYNWVKIVFPRKVCIPWIGFGSEAYSGKCLR